MVPLKEATWRGTNIQENQVTDKLALAYLISSVKSENLRFYYTYHGDAPVLGSDTSSGLPDDRSDTRHSAVEGLNLAEVNCDGVDVTGPAVAFWARNGSKLKIRDSQVQYGIQSLRSEGFAGINTLRGAEDVHLGFEVQGIRVPSALTRKDLIDEKNKSYHYLNANAVFISETTIKFNDPLDLSVLHPYSLKAGDVIWVESSSTGKLSKATLLDPPVSQDQKTINVEAQNNTIWSDNVDVDDLVRPPFIRRFVDPRPESQRDYSLWIKNTDTKHQAPVPGSVLRLSEDTGASTTPLLEPGYQLDPGANGGWNHVFKVHHCLTKRFGDDPNSTGILNQTTTSSQGYYVSLNPCDSFGPWMPTKTYGPGSFATINYKTYQSKLGQFSPSDVPPSDIATTWGHSDFFEAVVPVGVSYNNSDDLDIPDYEPNATYLRGVSFTSDSMEKYNPIDFDDGSDDLGLSDPNDSSKVDLNKIQRDWQPTYLGLKRFLELLGYESSDLEAVMRPEKWSNRNIEVASLGPLQASCGYAASAGNWPVEFNRPSFIWCESMLWDYPGHLNYSKGLAKYRKSQLSQQLQRDCEISEVWGGRVVATGLTADGDFINYRVTNV